MLKNKKISALFFSALTLTILLLNANGLAAEKTIGVIFSGDVSYYQDIHAAFLAKLGREGSAELAEVVIQKPYPDPFSLANAVRKLIALDVDVIVAYGAPAALTAVSEKTRIPIVYAGVYDPLAQRVKSKNATGISMKVSVSSLFRYLRELTSIKTLGVVYSSNEADSAYQLDELRSLSGQSGFMVEAMNLKRPQEVKQLFFGRKPDALFITSSSIIHMALPEIMDYAEGLKIPSASLSPEKALKVVVSLYADPAEQGNKAAWKVMRVLGGEAPWKISAESSHDIELEFNLKEATVKGWKIPMELVTGATRLIR